MSHNLWLMNINCKKELSNINGTLEYLETPYKHPARNPKGPPHTVFLWPNKPLIMHARTRSPLYVLYILRGLLGHKTVWGGPLWFLAGCLYGVSTGQFIWSMCGTLHTHLFQSWFVLKTNFAFNILKFLKWVYPSNLRRNAKISIPMGSTHLDFSSSEGEQRARALAKASIK